MTKLKNFFNKISKNNRIFSREDIGEMSKDEFAHEEKAIDYQVSQIGAPPNQALSTDNNVVFVQEYTKSDGTKVKAHYRSKIGEVSTGAAAPVDTKEKRFDAFNNFGNKAQEFLYTNAGKAFPLANDNLQNALYDMKNSKNNPKVKILNRQNIKNQSLNELFDSIGIPKNCRGSFYSEDSKASVQLAKSKQIDNFISNNYDKIKNGNIDKEVLDFNVRFSKDSIDNFLGLQHATLYKPNIDNDGNFNAMIIDFYDFNKRNGSNIYNIPNNWGYSMQQDGLLENQFNVYCIRKKLK